MSGSFGFGKLVFVGALLAATLTACGGGGGGDSATPASASSALAGTAAVGSPIVGATVTVRCAAGLPLTSQPTSSDGSWKVVLSGQTFPCAAQVNGGTINGVANTVQFHSLALGSGIMNVTPLTDLMVAFATRQTILSNWFNGLSTTSLNTINASSLNTALSFLVNALNMNQLGTTFHPITTGFTPVAGSVMDDTLSSLGAALRDIGMVYGDLRILVATPNAVPSSSLLGALVTRYSNSVSGIRASGGVNTTTGLSANGSPKVAVSNCALPGSSSYAQCQMNAIANFGPLSVVDGQTHQTCTASYTNGVLTVSNGASTVVGYLNGNMLSAISTFGTSGVASMNAYASAGRVIQINTLSWDTTGHLTSISGKYINILTGTTEISCAK